MNKKTIATVVVTGLLTALALTAFAETTSTTTPASTSMTTPAKITCVGNAVAAREQALDAGATAYTKAVNDAYTARASALALAYSKTTVTDVKAGIKSAWSNFNKAIRTAHKNWVSAKNSAWATFRTAAAACKASSSIKDSGNAGSEAMGQ